MPPIPLVPILATSNQRYKAITKAEPRDPLATIPACTSAATLSDGKPPLPRGFRPCIHPEGDGYSFSDEKRILTPSDIRDPLILDLILKAFEQLKRLLLDKARDRLAHAELYLEVAIGQSNEIEVRYYWADHATWQIFWLDDVPFSTLGLPALASVAEIKSRLTPEYWTHVEYHPVHLAVRLDAEEQLVGILSHGCVDNMTSPGSTFPFSAAECERYLNIIKYLRTICLSEPSTRVIAAGTAPVGYRNAVIARLWNAVARARHINAYGLDSPRLDRLQGLEEFAEGQMVENLKLWIFEILFFNLPARIFARLTSMWNGRVVYQRHWNAFFIDMRADWQRVADMGVAIWLGSSLIVASGVTNFPIIVALVTSGTSTFIALTLCHKHKDDTLASGPDISRYIMSVENYFHGLRPLSIIYVLPHALAIYAAIAFTMALVWIILQRVGSTSQALALITIVASAIVPIVVTLAYFDRSLDAKITAATDYLLEWFQNPFRKPRQTNDDETKQTKSE